MVTDLKMENEIKLTIIATGFENPGDVKDTDDGYTKMLLEAMANDNGKLDLPPFLRRYSKPAKV